jgi:aminoglycoside phosphotransferase (APT) family kinase protein
VVWAGDGTPLPALTAALDGCRDRRPPPGGPAGSRPALLWGDPRLGNLVFDDDRRVRAVLDWELAALGPPEMDLGWYFGLDSMMDELFGRRVAGFPERAEAVAHYEALSGHVVADLEWHEVFALVRALAINDRQQRVAAASGQRYAGGAPAADRSEDPLAKVLLARMEAAG